MSGFVFSRRSRERMKGVDPRLVEIAEYALTISKVDFGIPEYGGLRTAEQQAKLYADGKSKADGYTRKSYHQTGKALDVYAFVDGKASWNEHHLAMIAAAMLQAASRYGVALEWGGLWRSFIDMPHFQISRKKDPDESGSS
jgi:peptidoglycan L-alanyl-D-glutamate endopeptidase CwlK